jgi:hypothetical protein
MLWMKYQSPSYQDSQRAYLPRAVASADIVVGLSEQVWQRKYDIITRVYGFSRDSFEAHSTPRKEAFFGDSGQPVELLSKQ